MIKLRVEEGVSGFRFQVWENGRFPTHNLANTLHQPGWHL